MIAGMEQIALLAKAGHLAGGCMGVMGCMAGLRPPEEDIGAAAVNMRFPLALVVLFGVLLAAFGLLDRMGIAIVRAPQAIIVACLCLLVLTALTASARRPADFFISAHKAHPLLAGLAGASTIAGMCVMLFGRSDLAGADIALGVAAGLLLQRVAIAPRLRRVGGYAATDVIGRRFGAAARIVWSMGVVVSCFLTLLACVKTAGPMLAALLDLSQTRAGALAALLVAAAALPGGLRSSFATQVTQYFLLMLALLISAVTVALRQPFDGSGPLEAVSFLQDWTVWSDGGAAVTSWLTLVVAGGIAALPYLSTLSLSVSSERAAGAAMNWTLSLAFALAAGALALFAVSTQALGEQAVAAALDDPLAALVLLASLPPIVSGLLMAGVLLAILATAIAALLAAATLISRNLQEAMGRNKQAGGIVVGRMAGLALAAAAACISGVYAFDASVLLVWALALSASSSLSALLAGLWWKRCGPAGVTAGISTGLVAVCGLPLVALVVDAVSPGLAPAFASDPIAAGVFGMAGSALVMAAITLLGREPERLVDRGEQPQGDRGETRAFAG